ncbi:hypothetical protein BIW75_08745 [Salmonella enterica]|nr:hypothetical protein [Salmonella enterica]EAX6957160.1 hypothetical protein [Salmonella enterica]EKH8221964.1 hypothetical protein [Salmonella enterica]MIM58964.1 hypothetical protein [Salmonella enterica]
MKKIIAIAALAAAVSTCAHAENTFSSTLVGTHDVVNTTAHAVTFNVNTAYHPLTFVDTATDSTDLAQDGSANRVVVASKFTGENGHQYEVGNLILNGANKNRNMKVSFSSDITTPNQPTEQIFVKSDGTASIYVLLTDDNGTGLQAGSTTATYTVTDYAA